MKKLAHEKPAAYPVAREFVRLSVTVQEQLPRGVGVGAKQTPALRRALFWHTFLGTYRTLCLAPPPEVREVFEAIRSLGMAS